jgi:hypothetical protein
VLSKRHTRQFAAASGGSALLKGTPVVHGKAREGKVVDRGGGEEDLGLDGGTSVEAKIHQRLGTCDLHRKRGFCWCLGLGSPGDSQEPVVFEGFCGRIRSRWWRFRAWVEVPLLPPCLLGCRGLNPKP